MRIALRTLQPVILGSVLFLALGAPSNTQPIEPELENTFRQDFLDPQPDLDLITTESTGKREEVFKYCLNITDEAVEARHVVLQKRLKTTEAEVDAKLGELEVRIKELQGWVQKRERFLSSANDSLVEIFQVMRSDAAALQLSEVGPAMAASIIAKLEPKYSSAIMAEMKPDEAAKITMILTNSLATDEQT